MFGQCSSERDMVETKLNLKKKSQPADLPTHKDSVRTSLAVQWLGLCTSTAGGLGWISGQGTKIPQATRCSQLN